MFRLCTKDKPKHTTGGAMTVGILSATLCISACLLTLRKLTCRFDHRTPQIALRIHLFARFYRELIGTHIMSMRATDRRSGFPCHRGMNGILCESHAIDSILRGGGHPSHHVTWTDVLKLYV